MSDLTLTRLLLESNAEEDPVKHRRRVLALASRGPRFIFTLAGVGVLALAALGYQAWKAAGARDAAGWLIVIFVPLVALAAYVFASVAFRPERPRERSLRPEDAPELFKLIAKAREIVGAPPVHKVMLTGDFDLGAINVARFGVWDLPVLAGVGGPRNYLLVGMPLLQALSVNQFSALLVHQMMRLKLMRATPAGRVVVQRNVWWRGFQTLRRRKSPTIWPLRLFAASHAPKLYALSIPLVQEMTIDADARTAALIGRPLIGEAFIAQAVASRFYRDVYLVALNAEAEQAPQPKGSVYGRIAEAASTLWTGAQGNRMLSMCLAERSGVSDPTPALAERLEVLALAPRLPATPRVSAAAVVLGERLAGFVQVLDEDWFKRHAKQWRARFDEATSGRDELMHLKIGHAGHTLGAAEFLRMAELLERFEPGVDTTALYREALSLDPDQPQACFRLGMIRLAEGDPEAIALLDRAAEQGFKVVEAANLATSFLRARGETAEAKRFDERAKARKAEENKAWAELAELSPGDRFGAASLLPHEQRRVTALIQNQDGIAAAYLVRKAHATVSNLSFYVLGLEFRSDLTVPPYRVARVIEAELQLPGRFAVIILDRTQKSLAAALRKVPGSAVGLREGDPAA
jgi:hypothetical protein